MSGAFLYYNSSSISIVLTVYNRDASFSSYITQFSGCMINCTDRDRFRVSFVGIMYRQIINVSLVLFLLSTIIGCVSAPVQEMSDARQAIRAAKKASSTPDSQSSLAKAESLLKEAETALENGEYSKARDTATEARDAAIKAQQSSP